MADPEIKNKQTRFQPTSLVETLRLLEKEYDKLASLEKAMFEAKLKSLAEARKDYINCLLTHFFSRPDFYAAFPRSKGFKESPTLNDMHGYFRCNSAYDYEKSHVLFFPADMAQSRNARRGFIVLLEDGGKRWHPYIYDIRINPSPFERVPNSGHVCYVQIGHTGDATRGIVVRENVDIEAEDATYDLHLVGEKRPDTFDLFYHGLKQYTLNVIRGLPARKTLAETELPQDLEQQQALIRECDALKIIANERRSS